MSLTDQFLRIHRVLYERTDGRVGHRLIGVPSLMLRTTGRRSGQIRTAVLTYGSEAGSYVVVASNGGGDRPPAWLHNVEAQSAVSVQIGRARSAATARIVNAGDADYTRLWRLVNDVNHDRYDAYQRKTMRHIALVVLTPEGANR
jgi:deazaflavin-dependent oxidoreductase (nitroreductase family)